MYGIFARRLLPVLFLWTALVTGVSAKPESGRVLELDGSDPTPSTQYIETILEEAYAQIGYTLTYRQLPLGRSFVEVDKGRLDGLRARVDGATEKYPNLVKVPFEIFDFRLVLLADRRVCGICDVSSLASIATTRGMMAFEGYFSSHQVNAHIIRMTTADQALELLTAGKVEAVILPEPMVPESFYQRNHHWMQRTLAVLPDFHYLNKQHVHLVPRLVDALNHLKQSGRITELQEMYNISPAERDFAEAELGRVDLVSGNWRGMTDSADARYWKILRRVFADEVASDHNVTLSTSPMAWLQARQAFEAGKADILVGAQANEISGDYLRSDLHIDYDAPVFAFGFDRLRIETMLNGDTAGKACMEAGYGFEQWLPDNVDVRSGSNQQQCRTLLADGAVDMVITYSVDWPEDAFESWVNVQFLEPRPLFLAFHKSAKGRKLKHIFETEFERLIQSDQIANYFDSSENLADANLRYVSFNELTKGD